MTAAAAFVLAFGAFAQQQAPSGIPNYHVVNDTFIAGRSPLSMASRTLPKWA